MVPRKLHNTQWGIICPRDSKGGSVGLVKNLAISTFITDKTNSDQIVNFLQKRIKLLDDLTLEEIYNKTKVFVNGNWLGIFFEDSYNLYLKLKHMKKTGSLNVYTSISFNYKLNEINVFTDSKMCKTVCLLWRITN